MRTWIFASIVLAVSVCVFSTNDLEQIPLEQDFLSIDKVNYPDDELTVNKRSDAVDSLSSKVKTDDAGTDLEDEFGQMPKKLSSDMQDDGSGEQSDDRSTELQEEGSGNPESDWSEILQEESSGEPESDRSVELEEDGSGKTESDWSDKLQEEGSGQPESDWSPELQEEGSGGTENDWMSNIQNEEPQEDEAAKQQHLEKMLDTLKTYKRSPAENDLDEDDDLHGIRERREADKDVKRNNSEIDVLSAGVYLREEPEPPKDNDAEKIVIVKASTSDRVSEDKSADHLRITNPVASDHIFVGAEKDQKDTRMPPWQKIVFKVRPGKETTTFSINNTVIIALSVMGTLIVITMFVSLYYCLVNISLRRTAIVPKA